MLVELPSYKISKNIGWIVFPMKGIGVIPMFSVKNMTEDATTCYVWAGCAPCGKIGRVDFKVPSRHNFVTVKCSGCGEALCRFSGIRTFCFRVWVNKWYV